MAAPMAGAGPDPTEDVLGDLLGFHGTRKFPTANEKFPMETGKLPVEGTEAQELPELEGLDELDAEILGMARPGRGSGKGPDPGKVPSPAPPRPDVTFGDDVDDLVASLGLGGSDGAGNAPGTPGGFDHAGLANLLGTHYGFSPV